VVTKLHVVNKIIGDLSADVKVISLQNLLVEEGGTDTVVYRVPYNDYFRTDTKVFPAVEFLVELLQHLPDSRSRLVRTYGLYSSRARGTWSRSPHFLRLAPEGWKRDHPPQPSHRLLAPTATPRSHLCPHHVPLAPRLLPQCPPVHTRVQSARELRSSHLAQGQAIVVAII